MPETVNILKLAEYIVVRFQNEGLPVTPLKLQKLLYYIQAWHAVHFQSHPLFEELPEAWVNGPVYPTVFREYKDKALIYDPIKIVNPKKLEDILASLALSEEQSILLEEVIKVYGFIAPEKLVYLTHAEKPWNEAREGLGPVDKSNNKITIESMVSFYSARLKKRDE